MKLAILGGGNCYALNLAKHCHALGIDHFGIGRSERKPAPFWVEHDYRYRRLHLITDLPSVMAVLETERPDIIVNFAAQGEGQASFGEHSDKFYTTNSVALARLVEQLRSRDWLKRFIQIGTSELYGSVTNPSLESDPIRPSSPYAVSKAAFDLHLQIMHRVHGFPCNVIRPSNAITEGQQLHRIVPKAILCAFKGEKLPLHGGGAARKSYIHADDLSRAILTVIDKASPGEIYNCGPFQPVSIGVLVRLCATACGIDYADLVEVTGERTGQDGCYWLNSRKLEALGWQKQVELPEAVSRMVTWVRRYPELLEMSTDYRIIP
jgi:dTDP-glucose 4,6-dehydratase